MGQLSGIPLSDQEPGSTVLHDFRHGRRTARHHGQAGRHRLGEDQPEPFLDGRKAETVGVSVLHCQPRPADLAEERDRVVQPQLPVEKAQPGGLRPLSYDADLRRRDSRAAMGFACSSARADA